MAISSHVQTSELKICFGYQVYYNKYDNHRFSAMVTYDTSFSRKSDANLDNCHMKFRFGKVFDLGCFHCRTNPG